MITFDLTLTADWQEVLQGGSYLAFDCLSAASPEIYFSESSATPTEGGVTVASFPQGWDFEGAGFDAGLQRIWVRGAGVIRGVRQ